MLLQLASCIGYQVIASIKHMKSNYTDMYWN